MLNKKATQSTAQKELAIIPNSILVKFPSIEQ